MKFKDFIKIKQAIIWFGKKVFHQPFWFFMALVVFDLIIGMLLLWFFVLHPKVAQKDISQSLLVLNKNALDRFSTNLASQERAFSQLQSQTYRDIFLGFNSQSNIQVATSSNISATSSQ